MTAIREQTSSAVRTLKPKLSKPDPKIIAPCYLVRQEANIRGPLNLEGLQSLVYLGHLSSAAEFAAENTTEFKPASEWDFYLTLFPEEGPNHSSGDAPAEDGVKPVVRKNTPDNWPAPDPRKKCTSTNRKFYRLTEAKFHRINAKPGEHAEHHVYGMLKDLRQAEIDAGLDQVRQNRFRISKHTRDFWLLFISVNALLILGVVRFHNIISMVYGLSGVVFFSIALVWIMYGVMDRY